jgi:DNA invertase Pin-like site-specific DNA recombinase
MKDHARTTGRTPGLLLNYLDRLGRDGRDTVNTALDILDAHFRLRTIFEGDFEDTPEGRLMCMVHSGIAESGRFRLLKGTRDGLKGKAESGGYTGGPIAFGFRKQGVGKTAVLVPDDVPIVGLKVSPAKIVRRLFERAAAGESCQKLADVLNDLGVPTSRQNPGSIWRPNSVRVIHGDGMITERHDSR